MVILTFYDNHRQRIGSLLEGVFTDAFLLVEGVEIPVHRCILAIQSEYFSNLFSSEEESRRTAYQLGGVSASQALVEVRDTRPLSDNVFELKNTKVETVRAVLEYFYRGNYNYDDNVETHLQALELAHQFRLKDLEETLVSQLVKSITVENFVDFYNMNIRYKNDELETSCLSFLEGNGEEIAKGDNFSNFTLDSLLSILDEESFAAEEIDIFRAVEKWAAVNHPNNKTKEDIVTKIRLATISLKELFNVVKHSEELPSIDILETVERIANEDAASTNFRLPPVDTDLNVAQSSLGAEVLSGSVMRENLISGSSGCISHKVGGKPDCIVVKLKKTYRLNSFQLLLDSSEGRTYKYHIEVSVNEREWFRVVDHSNYSCRSHQFLRFEPRRVKFIRMTGTDEDLKIISFEAKYSNQICSLLQGIPVGSNNVVLESRGTAITGISGAYTNGVSYKPTNCIDEEEDSSASVQQNFPLIIKLGQPYWLSSVRVKVNARGNSYSIESSPDGESWQAVSGETKEEEGKVWRTFEFSQRIVLHFRVTVKKISYDLNINVHHFESPASNITIPN